MGLLEAGPGGGGLPSLTTLLFMYLDGGFNPLDAMVLSIQAYAAALRAVYGDSAFE